jgi:hypothetical protein
MERQKHPNPFVGDEATNKRQCFSTTASSQGALSSVASWTAPSLRLSDDSLAVGRESGSLFRSVSNLDSLFGTGSAPNPFIFASLSAPASQQPNRPNAVTTTNSSAQATSDNAEPAPSTNPGDLSSSSVQPSPPTNPSDEPSLSTSADQSSQQDEIDYSDDDSAPKENLINQEQEARNAD